MGSRYGGLKQIDPVGPSGEIVIDYSIYDALKVGFEKIVFVIRKDIEKDFRETIGSKYEAKAEVCYAFQSVDDLPQGFDVPEGRAKPWGTGHAVLAAKDQIDEPFAVINADDFYGHKAYELLYGHLANLEDENTYAMVGFALRNTLSDFGTVARGICDVDENGMLKKVVERTSIAKVGDHAVSHEPDGSELELTGDEWVSMNMWGFAPNMLGYLEDGFGDFLREKINVPKAEYFLPMVVDNLISAGIVKTRVLKSLDPWFGVTYQEDKPHVVSSIQKLVDAGTYPPSLFS
jgi:hypothetical protein